MSSKIPRDVQVAVWAATYAVELRASYERGTYDPERAASAADEATEALDDIAAKDSPVLDRWKRRASR